MKKLLLSWLIPLLIASGLFLVTRPVLAQIVEAQEMGLSEYLATASVPVGEETLDGFRRVYYVYNGQKNYISPTGSNCFNPVSTGKYVVYLKYINGTPQVFLYDILTNFEIKLSYTESNNAPYVSREGNVVWEGWIPSTSSGQVDGLWQIYLFDGKSVTQLTSGDLAIGPFIEGDFVSFARRDITGGWKSSLYSMKTKSEKDITVGNKTQYTKLRGGKITFELPGKGSEEFTLTAEDLFTLDLAPLSSTESANLIQDNPSIVTVEEILQELEITSSTSSGEINQ